MRRLVLVFALLASSATALTFGASSASAAINCTYNASAFIDTATFGGPDPAAQMTLTCTGASVVQFRFGHDIAHPSSPAAWLSSNGSNFKLFSFYLGINACGTNGLKPVGNPGTTVQCNGTGGTYSVYGYYGNLPWWSGCASITGQVEYRAGDGSGYGPWHQGSDPAGEVLCA